MSNKNTQVEIIPALMPESYEELAAYARGFAGMVRTVQVDVMDGAFVPGKTWPYATAEMLKELVAQEEGLPEWRELDYEFDLMIAAPGQELDDWIQIGAKRLIFHIESIEDPDAFFEHPIFTKEKSTFLETGVALNIDTPIERVSKYIESGQVDFVQCMGIARIGFQGQPFDDRVIHKIESLRKSYPELIISVDGGVNFETAPLLVKAGANRLVSGSAILESEDPEEAIAQLCAAQDIN